MLGGNIREMLARRGRSQRDLAKQLGVTQTMISRWVRSENTPDCGQLLGMSDFLGVSADDLLRRDLAAETDEETARRKAVLDICEEVGWEEARRRLLMPGTAGGRGGGLSMRGDHSVSQPVTLEELPEQVNRRAGRKADGDKAGSGSHGSP